MENRFGIRDLIVCVLLLVLIAVVLLAMVQYDRQWQRLGQIDRQMTQQAQDTARVRRELSELRGLLEQGVKVAGHATAGGANHSADDGWVSGGDPFERIRQAHESEAFAEGDWLIDAFGANVAKITPLVSHDVYGSAVQGQVLESLAVRDSDTLAWRGLLAEAWHVSEDGLTITFKMRRSATFSDGEPVTAHDVAFTFDMISNPAVEAPAARQFYNNIASVVAAGDHEVVFTFREPYYQSFGVAAGIGILPRHFYSRYSIEEFNRHPGLLMGSGPYRLVDPAGWAPGQLIELVRNERYWGEPSAFERLVYREVSNDVARLTMFRNGEIDRFGALPEQYRDLLADEPLVQRTQHYEYDALPSGYRFIAWNQQRGGAATAFADRRVRLAMTHLVDRQGICDEVLLGYATVASGPYHHLSPQADPSIRPWPYDVDRAKALLREAGFADRDGDGVLESADGAPLRFKLTYPSGSTTYDRIVLYLKDSFARAGVIVELDPLEWSVFGQRLQNRDFDAIMLGWGGGSIEGDIRQMFHSSQIGEGADNFISYANPRLDELIDQARQTIDEDARMPLWHACHRILHEDQPYTYLFTSKSLVFLDGRVANVQRVTTGLNDRTEWFVPAAMQRWK